MGLQLDRQKVPSLVASLAHLLDHFEVALLVESLELSKAYLMDG